MSDKTDFAREYLAWKEALKFTDDSPEAFEELQRLAQVDRRVRFILDYGVDDWDPAQIFAILRGEWEHEINEWDYSLSNDSVILVTAEDIEDVPLD